MTEELRIDPNDHYGKKIGILAAILAVLLSIFTITAHRSHTETIVLQNASNDDWSQYQSKRIRDYQLEMNMDLVNLLGVANPNTTKLIKAYAAKHTAYTEELAEIKKQADETAHESMRTQRKALYFDFAEGVLEIALVLSSLYFISHKKLFPRLGIFFALLGFVVGMIGFFI
jgi:hypothetical protein